MSILLIGFMGAGKTSLLHRLKQHKEFQNILCVDLDEEIAQKMKKSVEQVILDSGITLFRTIESELLHEFSGKNCIISCGGGVVELTKNHAILTQQCCIFLDAPKEVLFQRVLSDTQIRPVVFDAVRSEYRKDYFFDLYNKRKELYEKFANLTIDTETTDADLAIREIIEYCKSENPRFF